MINLPSKIPRATKRLLETIQNVGIHDHVCLLYRDREEGLASAVAFIESGLQSNDQCIYISDDNTPEEIIQALEKSRINVKTMQKSGQLILGDKHNSYLENGTFDSDSTIKLFIEASNNATSKGFRAVRGCAEMTWQLTSESAETVQVIDYESRINKELFPKHQVIGMCQYNMQRFSAGAIREIIHTHPVVIVGGIVCENFYYKPPEKYRMNHNDEIIEWEVNKMIDDIYNFAKVRYGF